MASKIREVNLWFNTTKFYSIASHTYSSVKIAIATSRIEKIRMAKRSTNAMTYARKFQRPIRLLLTRLVIESPEYADVS